MIRVAAIQHHVDPEFATAVAIVESRSSGQVFRTGPLGRRGKFYGPFGINRSFLKKWPIDDLQTNILVGCRALRGDDHLKILRRYNTACDRNYVNKVRQIMAILKQRHRDGDPDPTRGLDRL
jgi:hypothetical protein